MTEIIYKNKSDKYYKLNCYHIECPDCKKSIIKTNMNHHRKSQKHQMIVYCKKKMINQKFHYENKNNNMENLINEIKIDM